MRMRPEDALSLDSARIRSGCRACRARCVLSFHNIRQVSSRDDARIITPGLTVSSVLRFLPPSKQGASRGLTGAVELAEMVFARHLCGE